MSKWEDKYIDRNNKNFWLNFICKTKVIILNKQNDESINNKQTKMSGRGFLISVDSLDSLCEYQEHVPVPKSPKSPNPYSTRSEYFDKSHKGKSHHRCIGRC